MHAESYGRSWVLQVHTGLQDPADWIGHRPTRAGLCNDGQPLCMDCLQESAGVNSLRDRLHCDASSRWVALPELAA